MSIHINARPDDIAETVLMPGDPMRAKWAAQAFLEKPVPVNSTRGMLGFTGMWQGHRVTIQGSGMGMPTLSIYVNELIREYGVKTLLRIGSCGAMQKHVGLRDIVLPQTASSISTPSSSIFRDMNFAPVADFAMLRAADDAARTLGVTAHIGGIYSTDTFYDERPDLNEQLTRHGCLAVEMETAELYTLASRYGARALTVLTVSDHLMTEEALPSEERETSFRDMIQIALTAAFAGAS